MEKFISKRILKIDAIYILKLNYIDRLFITKEPRLFARNKNILNQLLLLLYT
jgi:hypothetical protein